MERVLLSTLGGHGKSSRSHARRPMDIRDLDHRTLWLQANAIEKSTVKCYTTGARDYLNFCMIHSLPIDPTPQTLSRYIAFTSRFIASGPKYLTGVRHYLHALYPDFDSNRSNPLVKSVIRGSQKIRADPVSRKLPLRLHHLSAFLSRAVSSQSYDDLLFITILSCSFYGCHRIGELVQKKMTSLSSTGGKSSNAHLLLFLTIERNIASLTTNLTLSTMVQTSYSRLKMLRTLLPYSPTMSLAEINSTALPLPYSFEKMGANQTVLGLMPNCFPFSITPLGVIQLVQEAQLSMLPSGFLKTSFKPLAAGLPLLGKLIFAKILLYALSYNLPLFAFVTTNSHPISFNDVVFILFSPPPPPHTSFTGFYSLPSVSVVSKVRRIRLNGISCCCYLTVLSQRSRGQSSSLPLICELRDIVLHLIGDMNFLLSPFDDNTLIHSKSTPLIRYNDMQMTCGGNFF